MSESGVGDDNRTAVSDEEVEAGYQAVAGIAEDYGAITRADVRLALEAAAAARRDVPGGREADRRFVHDLAEFILKDHLHRDDGGMPSPARDCVRSSCQTALRALRRLASHPLERADSERDA